MEPTLYQNVRIFDKKFPASIVAPFTVKCRTSICKCCTEMLWKMLLYFLSVISTSFLSIRAVGYNMTMFLQFGWSTFMVSFPVWKVSKYGVFSGPYFPTFGLNTESYRVSLRIHSECRKIRTRKNSVFGHFSRSAWHLPIICIQSLQFVTEYRWYQYGWWYIIRLFINISN